MPILTSIFASDLAMIPIGAKHIHTSSGADIHIDFGVHINIDIDIGMDVNTYVHTDVDIKIDIDMIRYIGIIFYTIDLCGTLIATSGEICASRFGIIGGTYMAVMFY